ncbi:MAG: hypothetical protein WBR10_02800 [Candidatus Acidiferrum sp.]
MSACLRTITKESEYFSMKDSSEARSFMVPSKVRPDIVQLTTVTPD